MEFSSEDLEFRCLTYHKKKKRIVIKYSIKDMLYELGTAYQTKLNSRLALSRNEK